MEASYKAANEVYAEHVAEQRRISRSCMRACWPSAAIPTCGCRWPNCSFDAFMMRMRTRT